MCDFEIGFGSYVGCIYMDENEYNIEFIHFVAALGRVYGYHRHESMLKIMNLMIHTQIAMILQSTMIYLVSNTN